MKRDDVVAQIDAAIQFAPQACRAAMLAAREALSAPAEIVITADQIVEAMLIAYGAPSDPQIRDALRGRMRSLAAGTRHCIYDDDRRAQDVARALGVKPEGEH